MKKLRQLLTALLLLCSVVANAAVSDFEVDGIGYSITSSVGKTVEVTFSDFKESVVIPESVTYNGVTYSVTSIGDYAFEGHSGLTSVTIGNSVTSIGRGAFYYCSGLTSVEIGHSVKYIGESAFSRCSSLKTFFNFSTKLSLEASGNIVVYNLPKGSKEGDYIFGKLDNVYTLLYYLGNEQRLILPTDCEGESYVIGENVFKDNKTITSIEIPNSVTSIGGYAFSWCTSLTSITIPNSVTSIGNSAFSSCYKLTSVTIGNSVTSIGKYAFNCCYGLTSVTIPNSVTSIGERAFYSCSGLTSVTIGNSVTSIGTGAFYDCSGLKSITIPNSVTSIGGSAFSCCTGITSITIPNSVTSIGNSAFSHCTGLTSVTIPNSVTSIGDYAFNYCPRLTSITIPNSVTSIGEEAFRGCSRLTSITIPNSVTSIGSRAFYECSNLKTVINLSNLTFSKGFSDYGYVAYYANKVYNPVSKFSNDELYYISQPRHSGGTTSWAVEQGGAALKSNNDLGFETAVTDSRQHFAILSGNGGATYYLYHAAEKKFVNKDGSLGTAPVDAICITAGAYENTFIFYFDSDHYINVGGNKQMLINGWRTPDGGNSCLLVPVGAFDPTDALMNFVKVTSISLSHISSTLAKGELLTLTATITPSNATDNTVTWTTSNSAVATVENGVVTAVAPGTATITARAGDCSTTCKIIVKLNYQLSNHQLYHISQPRHSGGATSWAVGQGGAALKSNNDLGIETSETDSRQHFAILSNDGGVTYYLYHAAEKKFVNKDGSLGKLPVDSVNLTEGAYENTFIFFFDSDHYINVGGSKQMLINDWRTPDGGNSCSLVSVGAFDPTDALKNFVKVTSISLSHTSSTLAEGESLTLTATITPSNAADNTVTWTTSNSAVATVENGVVTAVAPGTATITARAGDCSTTCKIKVKLNYQLSNHQLYHISQPRHSGGATSWAVEQGGAALKSNNDLGIETSETDSRQHFAILSNDGGATYYLYHAAEKKFVNKDGSLGTEPVDVINIIVGAYENTFLFYFDSDHYINVGGSKQMTIDWWGTPDGGNSCLLVPVGTFDPTDALRAIDNATAIENVECEETETVIYDLQGRRIKEITASGIYVINGKKTIVR